MMDHSRGTILLIYIGRYQKHIDARRQLRSLKRKKTTLAIKHIGKEESSHLTQEDSTPVITIRDKMADINGIWKQHLLRKPPGVTCQLRIVTGAVILLSSVDRRDFAGQPNLVFQH